MNECKKKLTSTVSKFDKINEMFSSAPIENPLRNYQMQSSC